MWWGFRFTTGADARCFAASVRAPRLVEASRPEAGVKSWVREARVNGRDVMVNAEPGRGDDVVRLSLAYNPAQTSRGNGGSR